MYAIIETGGKQYKVSEGTRIKVEKLPASEGEKVYFEKVLLVNRDGNTTIGSPYLENTKVTARVIETAKDKKVLVFKKKPRKGYKRLKGHRQPYTKIEIEKIEIGG